MTDNVSGTPVVKYSANTPVVNYGANAPGTPVVKYSANASGTPVVNYGANAPGTPVIPTSAKKLRFTPSSISRKSKQIEYPPTKLGRFHTQANINKHKKQRAPLFAIRRARMDAKFAEENAENLFQPISSNPNPRYDRYKSRKPISHITERSGWRKRANATKKRRKEQQNQQNYLNRLENFKQSEKAFRNYERERNPIMKMLHNREIGYHTGHQRRIIGQTHGKQHITVTTRDELNEALHDADYYPEGSTLSLETNAQGDGDKNRYTLFKNTYGKKKFVKNTTANPYNGGTRHNKSTRKN